MPVPWPEQPPYFIEVTTARNTGAVNIDQVVRGICAIVVEGVRRTPGLSDPFFDEGYAKTQMFGLRWRVGSGGAGEPTAEYK
jgi:hypothetical protein